MATSQRPKSLEFQPEPTPDYERVRPLLDKICESPGFRRSARLQRFLRYVTEQTLRRPSQPLKEYQVGVAVFDKGDSFDPQQDPIVRVEASRLRLRLMEYYTGPGLGDAITIEVPKGAYVPMFSWRDPASGSQVPVLVARSGAGKLRDANPERGHGVHSIAVLPFVNASADPETEYLSEGITETLTNRLTHISRLRVAPRGRVRLYQNPECDPLRTALELGVEFLLTGRVVLRGDRLRVQVELIDARQNAQVWGQSYTRQASSLFAIEDEIAGEILAQLRPKFGAADLQRVTKHETDNAAAYQHYLKGRYYWNKRTAEALTLGIKHFQQALDEDPHYARAHSGVADCYSALASFGVLRPDDVFPLAKAAAMRALELDTSLAEAHTSVAAVSFLYDWDWQRADEYFRRALELNQDYATAYHWYGCCLFASGKLSEGLSLLKQAQQLDPLSLIVQTQIGSALYLARQFDDAEKECQAALAMDPHFWTAHWFLGLIYQQKGLLAQASTELQQAVELSDRNTLAVGSLAHHYGLAGKRKKAVTLLNGLKQQRKQKYVNAYPIALTFAGLNNWEETLNWLERAYEDRSASLALWLKGDPRLDPLHADPKFRSLLHRIGLPG